MFWDKWKQEKDYTLNVDKIIEDITMMQTQIKELRDENARLHTLFKSIEPAQMGARVAELELKMAKLWDMLTEKTYTGKEKLSKFGRRFGGGNFRDR